MPLQLCRWPSIVGEPAFCLKTGGNTGLQTLESIGQPAQGVKKQAPTNRPAGKERKWKWSQPRLHCAGGKWSPQRRKLRFFGYWLAQSFSGHFCSATEAKGKKRKIKYGGTRFQKYAGCPTEAAAIYWMKRQMGWTQTIPERMPT